MRSRRSAACGSSRSRSGSDDGVENGQVYSIVHTNDTTNGGTGNYPTGQVRRSSFTRYDAKVCSLPREYVGRVGQSSTHVRARQLRPDHGRHPSGAHFRPAVRSGLSRRLTATRCAARSRNEAKKMARIPAPFFTAMDGPGCRKCRSIFRPGALDGTTSCRNEGRSRFEPICRKCRNEFGRHGRRTCRKCRSNFRLSG